MLRKIAISIALVALAVPAAASAQFSVGARAGLLGLGPEVAFGISDMLALKAGIGTTKYHYDGDFSDKQFTIDAPPSIWNAGIEFSPGGGKISFTSASCTQSNGQSCPNQAQFQSDVQAEAVKANKEIASYVKWHPIISLGFHYGLVR